MKSLLVKWRKGDPVVSASRPWFCRLDIWGVVAVTLLAAVLRFGRLDQPTLWYDEAMTFSRINGSFSDMLKVLQLDGFVPLHYELYWLLAHVIYPDPWVMRLIPAMAGVAMVPAIYFLARQLVTIRTALLTALLAASSGYLLKFSRDAKMYMLCWTLATFHLGFFFLWLRYAAQRHPKKRLAWLGWIAFGVAAAGTHVTSLLLLLIEALVLLLHRRPDRRVLGICFAWLLGASVMLAGPLGYYAWFNQWHQRTGGIFSAAVLVDDDEKTIGWKVSGLEWIERYHQGRSGPELVRFTASSFLTGWEWPRDGRQDVAQGRTPRWIFDLGVAAMSGLAILLAWGTMRSVSRKSRALFADSVDRSLPLATLAAVAMGMFLVVYGVFYCRSVNGFVSPGHWLQQGWLWVGWPRGLGVLLLAILAGWAMAACGCLRRVVGVGLSVGLAWTLLQAVHWHQAHFMLPWLEKWTTDGWLVFWAGLLASWWWTQWGDTPKERWLKAAAMAGLIVLGLALAWLAYAVWHQLWLKTCGHPELAWKNIWWPRYMGVLIPLMLVLVAVSMSNLPTRGLRWSVVGLFVGLNIVNGMGRVMIQSEPPWDRIAADLHQASRQSDLGVFGFQGATGQPWKDPNWAATANYYLCVAHRATPFPAEFRSGRIRRQLGYFPNLRRDRLEAELARFPQRNRVIVWQYFPWNPAGSKGESPSPPEPLSGGGWRLVSQENREFWDHWSWKHEGRFERREYVRATSP